MTGAKSPASTCTAPGHCTLPVVNRFSAYSGLGDCMQLVVIRMAPGNSANSVRWFCQAVP